MIDTHVHLNSEEYNDKIEDILARYKALGGRTMVIVSTNYEDSLKALDIATNYNLVAAVGVHPENPNLLEVEKIEKLLLHPKVVAIGEVGIDLYWTKDTLEAQKEVFLAQVSLAIKYHLPLIIHMRESFSELINLLKPFKGQVSGVFHCFTLGLKEAQEIIDLGFYLGIGGIVTFKSSADLRNTVQKIPLDKIVVETDSPYLAPVPKRGKVNEPSYVSYVISELAELYNMSYEEVEAITSNNAKKLFKL